MLLTRGANGIKHDVWRAMGTGERCAAVVVQPVQTVLPVALNPFIGGFAANAKACGQLADTVQAAQILGNELVSFFHGFSLVPRHGAPPSSSTMPTLHTCYPCSRSDLLPIHPACTALETTGII